MDAHLFEDGRLVHSWMACPDEKVREFRCNQERKKLKGNKIKKVMKV